MIIQCENCETKFKIDSSRIKPSGSNVRCSKCGHIFNVKRDEPAANPNDPELPGLLAGDAPSHDSPTQQSPPQNIAPSEDETLDIVIDHAPKDSGNWEDFVSISKTGAQDLDDQDVENTATEAEAGEKSSTTEGRDKFDWDKINIDDTGTAEEHVQVPDMFDDAEPGDEGKDTPREPREPLRDRGRQGLSLDEEREDNFDDLEGYYTKASEATIHRGSVYGKKSPASGALGKIISTLLIAAVFVIIIVASAAILINLELIPQEQVTRAKTLIESIIPVKLNSEPAPSVIITNHGGNWVNTRYGPLYVISGTIQNVSDTPIHYVQIRSVFTAAGELLYEDTIYAGNTFTENELKLSRTEDVVSKLKKKSGDIDYYNTEKLSGLNYDIKPGQTVPFFAVFPSDRRVLGLKYNLEVVGFESPEAN